MSQKTQPNRRILRFREPKPRILRVQMSSGTTLFARGDLKTLGFYVVSRFRGVKNRCFERLGCFGPPLGAQGPPQSAQEPPKTAQERPRSRPKSAQEPPKSAQELPKSRPRAPKTAQQTPKSTQERPRRPRSGPKRLPRAPRRPKFEHKPRVHGTAANAVRKYWSKGLSKPLHARSTKPHRLSGRYWGRQPHWRSGH